MSSSCSHRPRRPRPTPSSAPASGRSSHPHSSRFQSHQSQTRRHRHLEHVHANHHSRKTSESPQLLRSPRRHTQGHRPPQGDGIQPSESLQQHHPLHPQTQVDPKHLDLLPSKSSCDGEVDVDLLEAAPPLDLSAHSRCPERTGCSGHCFAPLTCWLNSG